MPSEMDLIMKVEALSHNESSILQTNLTYIQELKAGLIYQWGRSFEYYQTLSHCFSHNVGLRPVKPETTQALIVVG